MMRIAFSSCMFNRVFADQPVWGWIGAHAPDRLVLLGDSTYLDLKTAIPPQVMGDDEFARHLFLRYSELIAQPLFAALVAALPAGSVDAIWDDHDFLWNDATGAEVHPLHTEKVRLSTAFLEAFRSALHQRLAPGSFPSAYNDAVFWDLNQPPLTTPSIPLAPDLWLHLTDGRTFRTRTLGKPESKRTIFGTAQLDRFDAAIQAAPADAVHLWASGSTIAGYQRYARDKQRLFAMAAQHRMLVLSGDIHHNDMDAFFTGGALPLHEATSSGAAVKDTVIVGDPRRNFGLLVVDAQQVTIELFTDNVVPPEHRRVLDRQTWVPV